LDAPNLSELLIGKHLSRDALLHVAHGSLLGDQVPRLPMPPLLALDEVWDMTTSGGIFGLGGANGRVLVSRFDWVFDCHFDGDPVMPGSLMLDALFQLTGLFGVASGFMGRGRAVGVRKLRFLSEVLPSSGYIDCRIDIKRVSSGNRLIVADGTASCGSVTSLSAKGLTTVSI
jgi:3-hydroxyacyl-[acyl-carrier protein] dehydratase / trans-2-decenoyl-[acyl-carrier protein] isomerase